MRRQKGIAHVTHFNYFAVDFALFASRKSRNPNVFSSRASITTPGIRGSATVVLEPATKRVLISFFIGAISFECESGVRD